MPTLALTPLLTQAESRLLTDRGYIQRREPTTLAGVDIYEAVYAAEFEIPEHAHDRTCLTLLLDGQQHDTVERTHRTLSPGDLVCHPHGAAHANVFTQTTHCFELQLRPEWDGRFEKPLDRVFIGRQGTLARYMGQIYEESLCPDAVASLAVESLVCDIVTQFSDPKIISSSSPPPWLRTVRDLLYDYSTETPSLQTLASAVDRHPTHVAQAFRRHFGCTPGDYVRDLRLVRLRRSLIQSQAPLADIALSAGYFDQAHMARAFRAKYGLAPLQYRKRFGKS